MAEANQREMELLMPLNWYINCFIGLDNQPTTSYSSMDEKPGFRCAVVVQKIRPSCGPRKLDESFVQESPYPKDYYLKKKGTVIFFCLGGV